MIKPILGFPDYRISEDGVIFSKKQRSNQPKPKEYKVLRLDKCFGYNTIRLRKRGNYKEIAKMFNISATTVGAIVQGRVWRWLE